MLENTKSLPSEKQLAANRANARKSTGPKTIAGKNRSRFNGLIHGLAAGPVCLPGQDPADGRYLSDFGGLGRPPSQESQSLGPARPTCFNEPGTDR